MRPDTETTHRTYWLSQAARVRRRVNLAWWLESLSPPLLFSSIAAAAVLLWIRRELPATAPEILGLATLAMVAGIAIIARWRASRRFERSSQSLVRIEAAMSMRNALSAAEAGITPWPAPVKRIHDGLGWRWSRLWVPTLGSLAMLAAGLWVPISAKPSAPPPTGQPQAWGRLATELDYLASEELVDEAYIEETRKQLDQLESQPQQEWFSHSSLEATDTLRESHRAETGRVAAEMDKAADSLQSLGNNPSAPPAEQNRLLEDFEQALDGLRNGAMKPNPELLEQLRQLDLKNLSALSPEQLQQLREKLRENADKLNQCEQGEGEGFEGEEWNDGDGECEGDGEQGMPGGGQPQRGPGHVPGLLGEAGDDLDTGAAAALEAQDLSLSSPGDLLELQDDEHEVDPSRSALSSGGDTSATGSGGDRVWRDSLDPAEQRAIKRFFE
jgi:hypothetical protein